LAVIIMCESTVYIEENGKESEFMKDVTKIEITSKEIICYDIIGEKKNIPNAKLKLADLMNHKIIIQK